MAVFLLGMFVPRSQHARRPDRPGRRSRVLLIVAWATEIPSWWYGAFTIFPTLVVGVVASCFPRPPPSVSGCFACRTGGTVGAT